MNTPAECQNCGAVLSGRFCSACGQPGDVQIPTLGRVVVDALGDLLSFDSRLWRSLAVLAFKPGRLTNHYLAGRRARYTPPFRMYVITSLVFFVVFSLVRSLPAADARDGATDQATVADTVGDPLEPTPPPGEERLRIIIDDDDLECQIQVAPEVSPEVRADLEAACRRVENEIGASFGREFADNFPVLMLVFIPIVAAIMKALYLFARRKYVEHLLFFLHVHTFFFLVALPTIVLWGATAFAPVLEIPVLVVGGAAGIYFFVYLYRAMREVYRQGHGLTTVKYLVLGGSYLVAAMLTLIGGVILTDMTL